MSAATVLTPSLRNRRRFSSIIVLAYALTVLFTVTVLHTSLENGIRDVVTGKDSRAQNTGIASDSCRGWDPDGAIKDDPVDCLRARQYRQVQRVLAREIEGKHRTWSFTAGHNVATLRNLLRCFLPSSHADYTVCPPKPLILSGWWYTAQVIINSTSGEVIWQTAVMEMAKELGIAFVAFGPYENWVTVAEMMPDVHRFIWNSAQDTISCVTDPRCVAAGHYVPPVDGQDLSIGVPEEELGTIPIWALHVADYWGAQPKAISHVAYWWGITEDGTWSYHPLGQEWTVTPWPLPDRHAYLPYSIESHCTQHPITPHEEREDKVLIFAKRSTYFGMKRMPPKAFWTQLSHDPEFELLTTAKEEEGEPLPDGLTRLGPQSREAYDELVGNVKAIVGLGFPFISPSTYTALCRGTPLVLPYLKGHARMDGWNLYSESFQHGPVMTLGEPYVYTYYAQNYTQLHDAVHRAFDTPIERYIPPEMQFEFGLGKLRLYLERDLEGIYREVVARNGGRIPGMIKGVRERCLELKRCDPGLPAGRKPFRP